MLKLENVLQRAKLLAYADDLAMMFTARTEETLQERANEELDKIVHGMD